MMSTQRNLAVGLIATAFLALGSASAMAQTKWDLSTVWPDGNFHTKNAMRFADEVKKATNGGVVITVKAGGQLGFKGPQHLRAGRGGLERQSGGEGKRAGLRGRRSLKK